MSDIEQIDSRTWRIDGKIVRTSKRSAEVIESAAKKYAKALERLAKR